MKKRVELPLAEPMYATYHTQGECTAVAVKNPTIRNWILNESMILICSREFLKGRTTPDLDIWKTAWARNPYLESICFPMNYAGGYINPIIRQLIDNGYYVCFSGVDDYYVEGKSWYREKHFAHDGMICGYDQEDKTYCIYGYDSHWIYRKFQTSQKSFNKGREAVLQQGGYGEIHGIREKMEPVAFSPRRVYINLLQYLNSSLAQYPTEGEGYVEGSAVHDYIAMYIGKLADGSIPYEKMDRRIFRLIWEHKKVMLERIETTERVWEMDPCYSTAYEAVVAEADALRILYACYHRRRRDSLLPILQRRLITLRKREETILTEFTEKIKEVLGQDAVEPYKKENVGVSGANNR